MRVFGKRQFSKGWTTGIALGIASGLALAVSASDVTGLITFNSGTTASASDVNDNFTAVKNAVDDNNARITALEGGTVTVPCPTNAGEMVQVGSACVDKYEASLYDAATGGTLLPDASSCSADGNDCTNVIFARSVPNVVPAISVTWFQAQQACANVGKRLPTNAEWQAAAAGTPGTAATATTECNLSGTVGVTGDTTNFPNCQSNLAVFDMVGNVWEWVADWNGSTAATTADASANIDGLGRGGGAADTSPGANANVLFALSTPLNTSAIRGGFRCAR